MNIELLAQELNDERIVKIMQDFDRGDLAKPYENLYHLSLKHTAEHLLDKYTLTESPQPTEPQGDWREEFEVMEKMIKSLYIAVHEDVADAISNQWNKVKHQIQTLKQQQGEAVEIIVDCPNCGEPWNLSKNNTCGCGALLTHKKK